MIQKSVSPPYGSRRLIVLQVEGSTGMGEQAVQSGSSPTRSMLQSVPPYLTATASEYVAEGSGG